MEIEFHYFITKGIALRAGFSEDEAEILAHASQLTDDNVRQYCINRGKPDEFRNYISFTYNILKPRKSLTHIYTLFHYIPGDPETKSQRIDRKKALFNTTSDSRNALNILQTAFETGNRYRIGIALHTYADAWAHQNFTGLFESFNAMPGIEEAFIPDIGHADAKNKPEYVSYSWTDPRLQKQYQAINNNQRFLAAAKRIFEELCLFKGKSKEWIIRQSKELQADIAECFGRHDQNQHYKKARIAKYKKILGTDNKYKTDLWFNQAVKCNFPANHFFKPHYDKSHWFLFQQEVIKYQNDTYKILEQLFETTGQKNEWIKL